MRISTYLVLFFFITTTTYEADGRYHNHPFGNMIISPEIEAPPLPPPLPPATQQDTDDAAKIIKDQFAEKTISSIFPYRSLQQRQVINQQIASLNNGKRLIEDDYLPNHIENAPFKDLCFALLNDPLTVLTMYLGEFLHQRDETFITISLNLCQQIAQLHYIYDKKHDNNLAERCMAQRHPFAYLMRAWLKLGNRESDQSCTFHPGDEDESAEALKDEYPHWDECRDSIEYVLIKRCTQLGAAAVKKFEDDLKITIEKAIQDQIKNQDLVDAYTSLALYVKDRYHYMAKILFDHSNGTERWSVWAMVIGITASDDWPQIDKAFRQISGNVALTDYILSNSEPDKDLLGMMAAVIDPKSKPKPTNEPSAPNI